MAIYFSGTTGGFYDSTYHKTMPNDVIKITPEKREYLRDGVRNGRIIAVEGGEVVLKDAPPLPDSEKIAIYRSAVGAHIDQQARSFGFDSIVTAVTYADEPADPLNQSYGVALRAWRSKCWEKCREVLATWQGGGAEPTVEELIASLPDFVGP